MRKLVINVDGSEEYIEISDSTPTIEEVEQLKVQKIHRIIDSYKLKITSGFVSLATGTPVTYGYSQQDQLNYSKWANVLALDPSRTSITIGSESHGVVSLTKDQFLVFIGDAETHEMSLYAQRKDFEAQISSATTVDQLNMIPDTL